MRLTVTGVTTLIVAKLVVFKPLLLVVLGSRPYHQLRHGRDIVQVGGMRGGFVPGNIQPRLFREQMLNFNLLFLMTGYGRRHGF
jgi:hypothetical protein